MATRARVGDRIDRWCQANGKTRDDIAAEVGLTRVDVDAMAKEWISPRPFSGPGPGKLGSVVVPAGREYELAKKYGADVERLKAAIG